jgi:hypothetical protein
MEGRVGRRGRLLFCSLIVSDSISAIFSILAENIDILADFPPRREFLLRYLQEWLPDVATRSVEDCSRTVRSRELFLDLLECRGQALGVRYVCADADGFAALVVDFLRELLELVGAARKEHNRIGFGEASGGRCTCPRANTGDDGKGLRCHD